MSIFDIKWGPRDVHQLRWNFLQRIIWRNSKFLHLTRYQFQKFWFSTHPNGRVHMWILACAYIYRFVQGACMCRLWLTVYMCELWFLCVFLSFEDLNDYLQKIAPMPMCQLRTHAVVGSHACSNSLHTCVCVCMYTIHTNTHTCVSVCIYICRCIYTIHCIVYIYLYSKFV